LQRSETDIDIRVRPQGVDKRLFRPGSEKREEIGCFAPQLGVGILTQDAAQRLQCVKSSHSIVWPSKIRA